MLSHKVVLYFVRNIWNKKIYIENKCISKYKKLGYKIEEEWVLIP